MKLRSMMLAMFASMAVSLSVATLCRAADDNSGISVTGSGTVKIKPSVVEITASVSGEGELANDASVKFRDARKKAIDALDALKNPSLSVESKGFAVNQAVDAQAQMRAMQGMGGDTNTKPKVAVTEQLKLVVKDVDKLEFEKLMEMVLKVIDTGRDNGLQIGPGSMNYYQMQMAMQNGTAMSLITFKAPDLKKVREEAYKKAFDDARASAAHIAELSGVKLGRILSIHDQSTPNAGNNNYYEYQLAMQQTKEIDGGLSGNIFGEMPLTVKLSVQFEIEK